MAQSPNSRNAAKPGRIARTGAQKMQMNHRSTREAIARIRKEAAERISSGKPAHPKLARVR